MFVTPFGHMSHAGCDAPACARLAASGEGTRGGEKASALAARPEVERLELMPAGRQKREETLGISPVTGRAASICAGWREPFGGGGLRLRADLDVSHIAHAKRDVFTSVCC
jgi:hypothetical protein